jgi:hypothetical protein
MSPADFHKFTIAVLLSWGLLSLALVVAPAHVAHFFTRGRVGMSPRVAWIFRILGAVNAFGAVHVYFTGR